MKKTRFTIGLDIALGMALAWALMPGAATSARGAVVQEVTAAMGYTIWHHYGDATKSKYADNGYHGYQPVLGMIGESSLAGASSPGGSNVVIVFELPQLAAGHAVATAEVGIRITHQYGEGYSSGTGANLVVGGQSDDGPFGVDLWGIGFQNTLDFIGNYTDSDTDADVNSVKIQNDWFLEEEKPVSSTFVTTSGTDGEALAAYLQTFYDTNPGYTGGSYVFLRLNPDRSPMSTQESVTRTGYRFYTAGTAETHDARLTLTTTLIPEPASLALLAMGGLAMAARPSTQRRGEGCRT